MEQSPSWEANRFSNNQEIHRILWNPNVHCRVHKCPPPVPILSHIDQSIPPHPTSWWSILILYSHLHQGLPSGLFPSGFPIKTLYTPPPLPHMCYMPRSSHSSRFYHPNNIGWGVQIIKLLIMQLPQVPCYLFPHRSKYSPQHPILKYPQPAFIPQC